LSITPPSANKGLALHGLLAFSTKYISCFVCAVGDTPNKRPPEGGQVLMGVTHQSQTANDEAAFRFDWSAAPCLPTRRRSNFAPHT
jgi:hypothetical protein